MNNNTLDKVVASTGSYRERVVHITAADGTRTYTRNETGGPGHTATVIDRGDHYEVSGSVHAYGDGTNDSGKSFKQIFPKEGTIVSETSRR